LKKIVLLLGAVFLLFVACGRRAPRSPVLAEIGDRKITVEDFRRNYEFGLSHLKTGPDRKRTYLNYMINEAILAQQGYKLGLQNSERVRRLEQDLMDELLVEAWFDHEVASKITVTPQEIRDAITKAKVSWKLRYWYEPNVEFAGRVHQAMLERGYTSVVDEILRSNPEVQMQPKDFETGYLTYLDVSDELLAAIQDLPMGEISQPVEMEGGFFIFQVLDIRRQGITEYEYQERAESYRQILYYRKLNKAAAAYTAQFMTPKNVTTKGEPFRLLADALQAWAAQKQEGPRDFLKAVRTAQPEDGKLYELGQRLGTTLVTFEGGAWTVEDYLKHLNPGVLKRHFADRSQLRNALNNEIAIAVRDHFFTEAARKKKLDRLPSVQSELTAWRNKWVFEECRRYYGQNVQAVDDQAAADFFNAHLAQYRMRPDDQPLLAQNLERARRDAYHHQMLRRLDQVIDSLQVAFPVVVHQDVLDTIKTVEFEKSRWASMQVYKRSSNRLAVPIVDPGWGAFIKQ